MYYCCAVIYTTFERLIINFGINSAQNTSLIGNQCFLNPLGKRMEKCCDRTCEDATVLTLVVTFVGLQ